MENLSEEIGRIKELILYEAFDEESQKRIINKYVQQVIMERIGAPLFERFFNGEETIIDFTEKLIEKIENGDYGDDFGQLKKNLSFLNNKRLGAVLGITERFYKKNELPEEDLNDLKVDILYGNFCRTCINRDQVNSSLEKKVKEKETNEKEPIKRNKNLSQREKKALKVMSKYGGRGEEILAKYGIYGKSSLSMGDYDVVISLDDPSFREKIGLPKDRKTITTTYDAEQDTLTWRTPKGSEERYDYVFKIGTTPEVGEGGKVKVLRRPFAGGIFKEFAGETKITIKKVNR